MSEEQEFQTYRDFSPTPIDPKGLGADRHGIGEWFVMPTTQTRDSGPLAQSNFDVFLEGLGGESAYVEVHRFGHWGPGWFEIILVKPTAKRTLEKAAEMAAALEDYPILNEEDYSRREYEEACQAWDDLSIRERIEICAKRGVSIFAARRDSIPEGLPHFEDFYTDY